ncbi:hypothetical protein DSO57_1020333 [Entomophthora muscae]|uniref:Uncharacterized protein n=1 Tax=Entomophthora muscae TaxID=34485 RepID=A0ACC2T470_9FUNG|nr:hypothetical protein DSO57_1020333 [Entomophthora muscae]
MELPMTPKPMPASLPGLPTDHTGKLFENVSITPVRVIDTIIPAAGPWFWVGKSMSYLIKLALILWWALSAKPAAFVFPENDGPAAQGWIPDRGAMKAGGSMGYTNIKLSSTVCARSSKELSGLTGFWEVFFI